MTRQARSLLEQIHGAFPDPHPVDWERPGLEELRDLGFVDLYDMGPRGEERWTATAAGKAALNQ